MDRPLAHEDTIALEVRDLGLIPYAEALALQSDLVGRRRIGDIPDQLLLLQHPHVITLELIAAPAVAQTGTMPSNCGRFNGRAGHCRSG